MADITVGQTKVFTIPANDETKLLLPSATQHFSIQSRDLANTVFFRFDGEDAAIDDAECHVMDTSIAGYAGLYSENVIGFISLITATETDVILFNVY